MQPYIVKRGQFQRNSGQWQWIMESTYNPLELFSSSKILPYDIMLIGVIPGACQSLLCPIYLPRKTVLDRCRTYIDHDWV
eukprot:9841061-Ditylum_brightwellii.AAC.1